MPDTAFSDSYIATDAILEAMIGADPRASSVALNALGLLLVGGWHQYLLHSHNRQGLQLVSRSLITVIRIDIGEFTWQI